MLKDKQSIQVTIRVRPLSQKQKIEDSRLCVQVEQQTRSISTFFANQTKKFSFDSICYNNSQQDIFQKVGKKNTTYCLEGYNCTIFAYGQTGSGKTFTMMGVNQESQKYQELRGLIPRTLEYLFQSIDEQMKQIGSRYLIKCSFLEIYNEQIIDLLNKNNSNLQIREDIRKGVYVEGITQQTIQNSQQALDILNKGSKERHVGSTCYNQTSSRSHSVFTMQIQSKHEKNGLINTKIRHFHFIDLAGSQRTNNVNGDRFKQGCNINKSLMVLGKVINSLVQSSSGKAKHINYRDSKLTFLLKDSLGGNSKTHLIANVSPCLISYNQTNNTLGFARRVKQIKVNKASINQDATGNLQSLKNQIKRLKQQIISLRNGQINPLQISRRSQKGQITSDTKMAIMLNQYVSDQIDRQTKFQIQVGKLNKKVQNLQSAIQKYSQNQIQLRLIIKIYQDKIGRVKEIQSKAKYIQNSNPLNFQNNSEISSYFLSEREFLLNQIDTYKKLCSNQSSIKHFLKTLKIYQNDQSLSEILCKNSQFLFEIKKELASLQTLKLDSYQTENQIIQSRIVQLNEQFCKKQSQYLQKIESLEQMISQIKVMGQENELLLKEAVDNQINLEQRNKKLQCQTIQLSQQLSNYREKLNIVQIEREGLQAQKNVLLQTNQILKIDIKQKDQLITQGKQKYSQFQLYVNKELAQKTQQITHLKDKYKEVKTQNQQFQQISRELKQKVLDLQSLSNILKSSEQHYKKQIIELISNIQKQKKEEIQKHNEIQNLKQIIQAANQLQEKNEQTILKLKQKVQEYQFNQKKLHKQIQKLVSNLSQSQFQIKQKQSQIQTKEDKIKHFQQSSKSMETQLKKLQQSLVIKNSMLQQSQKSYCAKVAELMALISSMESNHHQNNQQINSIRLTMIKLSQSKQEIQFKLKSQIEKMEQEEKEMLQKHTFSTTKLTQAESQLKQEKNRINQLKKQISSIKQIQKLTNIELLQSKSEVNQLKLKLEKCTQQNSFISEKGLILKKELNDHIKQLQETKTQLKTLQNDAYIKEKTFQVEKGFLQKQFKIKQEKFQSQIKQAQKQKIKMKNEMQLYTVEIQRLQKRIQDQKQISSKNQQSFKKTMSECLVKKQKQISDLKQNNDQIKEQLNKLNLKYQQINQQLIKIAQKNQNLQDGINTLSQEKSQLNEQIQRKSLKQKELKQFIQQMERKYENEIEQTEFEHNRQIDNKNQKIQDLQFKLKNLQQSLKSKTIQLQKSKQNIQISQKQLERFIQRETEISKELFCLKEQKQTKNAHISQLQAEIQKKNDIQKQKERNIQKSKEEIQFHINQIQQKQNEIAELKLTIQKNKRQNDILNLELNEEKRKSNKIQQKFQKNQKKLHGQMQKQKHQREILQKIVQAKSRQMQLMHQQITNLNQQIQKANSQKILPLNEKISQYEEQLNQIYQKYENICSTLQETNKKLYQNMNEYEKCKQECAIYHEQIKKNREQNIIVLQDLCKTKFDLQNCQKENKQLKQQRQSYRSLQSINKALGQKCEQLQLKCNILNERCNQLRQKQIKENELQDQLEAVRQNLQKLYQQNDQFKKKESQFNEIHKKYTYQKQLNNNLKTLIQNSETQKRQLSFQLQQKNQFYNQLLQKFAKNQTQTKRVTNSEHYLKTVQLLQKSRSEQIQLKKAYQQLKKHNLKLKQEINKKEDLIEEIKKKSQQYCNTIIQRNKSFQNDYIELQKKYSNISKQKKAFQKVILENQHLKTTINRLTLKIQELQQKLKIINQEYLQLEKQVQSSKKKMNLSENQEKLILYINKLKSEVNDLKRQKQILTESLKKQSNQKVSLKSQMRYNNQFNMESQIKSQLQKKVHQIRYLQEIISETFQACKIKKIQPKPKLQTVRNLILNFIKESVNENQELRKKLRQMQQKKQNMSCYQKSGKDMREKSNSMFVNLRQRHKIQNLKQRQENQENEREMDIEKLKYLNDQNKQIYQTSNEPLCNLMRSKINKTGTKYSQMRQSAEKGVLINKDVISNYFPKKLQN